MLLSGRSEAVWRSLRPGLTGGLEVVTIRGSTIFMVIALVAGVYLFWRAMSGGGPLFYFLSAVAFGMAISAWQQGRVNRKP